MKPIIVPVNARFPLGKLYITSAADKALAGDEVADAVIRHSIGDWGDLVEGDRQANDEALKYGGRLLSAYHARSGEKFWVITEADRSATTVLLPDDY